MEQTRMLVVSPRGENLECLVSLRVSRAKHQYLNPLRSNLGLHAKK